MLNKTVTIQTKEGQYEATLTVDNDSKCPLREIQEKVGANTMQNIRTADEDAQHTKILYDQKPTEQTCAQI